MLLVRFATFFFCCVLQSLAASAAPSDDRFALALNEHGDLLVFGPKGEQLDDFALPAISQSVSIGNSTFFQVSFGRDQNNRLSVILAPNTSHPSALHFDVLNKSVDTDPQAVVTLTFAPGLNTVTVDPGYIGVVHVNARSLPRHRLGSGKGSVTVDAPPSSSMPGPHAFTPPTMSPASPTATSSAAAASTATSSAPAAAASAPSPPTSTAPRADADLAPRDLPPDTQTAAPKASSPPPVMPSASPVPVPSSNKPATEVAVKGPLFWSEPVTAPDGTAPQVGVNEMKLVEVQGSVSVKMPDGSSQNGTEGMLVPSGATVSTQDEASAAIFIGGIDSARLLPNSVAVISGAMDGTVRHTTLDLQQGTVFSRVGRRSSETQQYEVHTPEGVSSAHGTEFADHLEKEHHFLFVERGTVDLSVNGTFRRTVHGNGGAQIGRAEIPIAKGGRAMLHQILIELQPFDKKTLQVVRDIHDGKATPAELTYYKAAVRAAANTGEKYGASPAPDGSGELDAIRSPLGSSVPIAASS